MWAVLDGIVVHDIIVLIIIPVVVVILVMIFIFKFVVVMVVLVGDEFDEGTHEDLTTQRMSFLLLWVDGLRNS